MSSMVWLSDEMDPMWFPPPWQALTNPNGLLAAGGSLQPERLIAAYERGIFPWYVPPQPVLWWSPDPRAVLYPQEFHVSRSLRRRLRSGQFQTRLDTAFGQVIRECAAPRPSGEGTWITEEMIEAYTRLHELGYAHSVETWQGERLVGGLYGVCIGGVFCGESMFSRVPDASKVALARLVEESGRRQIVLIDCQIPSPHLTSLGSRLISRAEFLDVLRRHGRPHRAGRWT